MEGLSTLEAPEAPTLAAPAAAPAPPIRFRGAELRAPKRFMGITHRCVSPAETLERVRPHFRAAGLTRLADITGLDRIGIPVTVSYRPNAQTLSSASGKGFSLEASLVSGAMEAIELYHAENVRLPDLTATYRDLEARGPVIARDRLPLTRRPLFSPDRPEFWLQGWDVMRQEEVPVPWDCVSMVRHPRLRHLAPLPFLYTSNGLASGNHFLEAACAGLLEAIERDASACHEWAQRRRGGERPRVRLETVAHPLVRALMEKLDAAGVALGLYDCTVDTGVPVYMARVWDRQARATGIGAGYGCHLDPEIAMVRAITEAAQGRLVYIAGARDDMFRHDSLRFRLHDSDATIRAMEAVPATVDVRDRASQATGSFEGDLHVLLGKLRGVGLDRAILLDLSHEEIGVPVVRTVVPGLEGYVTPHYAPGPRALAFAAGTTPAAEARA